MRTKKPKSSESRFEAPKSPENFPPSVPTEQRDKQKEPRDEKEKLPDGYERKGFSFYVGQDGRVDMERMRENTRKELRELLKRPEVIAAFGDSGGSVPSVDLFPEESLDILYDVIGRLIAFGFIHWGGVQKEIAAEVFPFTTVEKKLFRKPTAKILSKYTSNWFVKYQDEVILAMLLSTSVIGKLGMLRMRQAQMRPVEVPVSQEEKVPVQ